MSAFNRTEPLHLVRTTYVCYFKVIFNTICCILGILFNFTKVLLAFSLFIEMCYCLICTIVNFKVTLIFFKVFDN